jgi:hypothetical protein
VRLAVFEGWVVIEGQIPSVERNSLYRGNVSVCGKKLTLQRERLSLWKGTYFKEELLSVRTHFTEGPSLSVGTRFTGRVTVCGKNTLYRGNDSDCGEGTHFTE